ncbi:MAG: BON domain-containing protein [Burkholderiaceae bacterium]
MISNKTWRTAALLLASATMATQLAGCFPVFVGAVGAGAYATTDRRSLGAQTDDKVIDQRVSHRIEDALSQRSHVNVNVFNRKVLLTGEVPDEASRQKAEQIAKTVDNVQSVVADLEIGGMTPSTARNNDTFITGKVKTELVSRKDIFANAYKVVTEKSIVYLMGRVTREEGERAAETARNVSGVAKVVKVFDYISDDELAQIRKSGAQ